MKKQILRAVPVLLVLVLILTTPLYASGDRQGRRQGPPPEAIEACEGKSVGDSVTFTDPRGGSHEGTCREIEGQLAAAPDDMPERGGKRQ